MFVRNKKKNVATLIEFYFLRRVRVFTKKKLVKVATLFMRVSPVYLSKVSLAIRLEKYPVGPLQLRLFV